ncbi:1,5-anhydro-D-fructose reductase [Halyomorpha halys]|uniref:1,5-anhydro-D-fructose reductase n=1 Tax=Halyomorpha halys TaxID=286706 RepID=UPI0006D51981|nr:1,5-anhydro-D-fructose reductase-like [Halyomorpha halys]
MAPLTKNSLLKHSTVKMPYIGLGTMQIKTEEMDDALNTALDAGYRHFDTAFRYNNEADIGRSLKKIFESGKIKREELFIVTKLPHHGNRREDVEYFLKRSLADLQLDYVDLYLVHSPIGYKRHDDITKDVPNFTQLELDMETDLVDLWKGMEAQVDAGRAKYIGISKFNSRQIQKILDNCRIRPVNLQIEMTIYLQEKELVAFCHQNDITVTAFSPFGSPGIKAFVESMKDAAEPLKDPVIQEIAKKYNKQPAQIILRFLVECGVGIIPKSSNPTRIKQNIDVFDFELTKEEFERIRDLERGEDGRIFGKVFFGKSIHHPEYPFGK